MEKQTTIYIYIYDIQSKQVYKYVHICRENISINKFDKCEYSSIIYTWAFAPNFFLARILCRAIRCCMNWIVRVLFLVGSQNANYLWNTLGFSTVSFHPFWVGFVNSPNVHRVYSWQLTPLRKYPVLTWTCIVRVSQGYPEIHYRHQEQLGNFTLYHPFMELPFWVW